MRRRDVFELNERLDAAGQPLVPLDIAEVEQLAARLDGAYDAVAVCLLHSYINAAHERRVVESLRAQLVDAVVVALARGGTGVARVRARRARRSCRPTSPRCSTST